MFADADIADLISRAHATSIKVYAAYGAPDWPSLGCSPNGFPMRRLADVLGYNAVNTNAAFDGVMLDIEPPTSDLGLLLVQYDCFLQQAAPTGLQIGAAIRFGWKDTLTFKGIGKPFYQHAIDLILAPAPLVVMGYRDSAGTPDPLSDGIVASDSDQILYAGGLGRPLLAGLETSDPVAVGITNKETFFEEGQSVLNAVAQDVVNDFTSRLIGLAGFAVHNYGSNYLGGGSAKWPTVNPNFPSQPDFTNHEFVTLLGGPVTVTPPPHMAGTDVGITFPTVTASGNTYVTALDPVTLPPLPTNYFSFAGLAFDISTTAAFTGPVKVCFSNMDVGTTDFSTLRVLHYTAAGIADETILSGSDAPNAATRTVCASVTSFSPFRIGHCAATKYKKPKKTSDAKPDRKCRNAVEADDD